MAHYLQTKKGYDFFEVSSTIQKAIRRGEEDTALYFTVELFNSGFDEYLWERLKIIVSEDVGLAEPAIPSMIESLYAMYSQQKKKKKDNRPERLFLVHAVIALVRCKKSRYVDWAVIKIWREHDQEKRPIPDYAYDMHNQTGKRMGRGLEHFYDEGSKLENFDPIRGEILMKTEAYAVHKHSPKKLSFGDIAQQTFDYNEKNT